MVISKYIKSPQHVHFPRAVSDSLSDIVDREGNGNVSTNSNINITPLLQEHATLLLSIGKIAQSEITKCPSALSEDSTNDSVLPVVHHRRISNSSFPSFPKYLEGIHVSESNPKLLLIPRSDSLRQSLLVDSRSRPRSVSFDSPTSAMKNIVDPNECDSTSSELMLPPSACLTPRISEESAKSHKRSKKDSSSPRSIKMVTKHMSSHRNYNKKSRLVSPRPTMHGGRMINKKSQSMGLPMIVSPRLTSTTCTMLSNHHNPINLPQQQASVPLTTNMKQRLQGIPPNGITIKNVYRRKFSWKNYPQLEEFLINHRDEYLLHSALNYTIQQKNYNNTLTQDLLVLATQCGYMFDVEDFNFVTVRDRIRCYYKSYVQSAKKRGILMGYAAKKAGLLKIDSLCSNTMEVDHDDDDEDSTRHQHYNNNNKNHHKNHNHNDSDTM